MIKAEEINRWIRNANEFCESQTCEGCPLYGKSKRGINCQWRDGEMTQDEIDLIAAFEPSVNGGKGLQHTKTVAWDDDQYYRQYFDLIQSKYEK